MTEEELEIAKAAYCVGKIWDSYEGKENFDHMVGLRVKHLIELVRNYQQSSLPSDLDEAAEEALDDVDANWQIDERDGECTEPGYNQKQMLYMYKAGAEWMAGQGETFNGYISVKGKRSLIAIEGKSDIYKYGDKVVVQIRKK